MAGVIIGVDPHKLTATIEVVGHHGHLLGSGQFTTDRAGYTAMRGYVKAWPQRIWAVEGANGAGRPLAQRLVATGERVVDVQAKLAARVRLFDTGHNRNTDALDAHSIAMVALRAAGLRELAADGQLQALRMLADRRDDLAHRRVQTVNGLQRLLSELVPGQRKRTFRAAGQGDPGFGPASRRGRDDPPPDGGRGAGRPGRRRCEAEEDQGRATRRGHHARLGPDGHHRRRPGRSRPDLGRCRGHRQVPQPEPVRLVDRDRAAGRVLRRAHPPPPVPGREPADEPRAAHRGHRPAESRLPGLGVLPEEARRRQDPNGGAALPQTTLSDVVYRRLVTDASAADTGQGGTAGRLLHPARSTCTRTSTSDQPLPGPATPTLRPTQRARKTTVTTADQPVP